VNTFNIISPPCFSVTRVADLFSFLCCPIASKNFILASLSVVMVMNAHIIYIDIYIYDWWCSVSKVEFESRQREKNVSKEI
jgi:hypothetical protein